jgi:hypothetical protein
VIRNNSGSKKINVTNDAKPIGSELLNATIVTGRKKMMFEAIRKIPDIWFNF